MTFDQALKDGDLDVARAILAELVDLPDTGGLWMPECYADLAREYARRGRHDDAIALLERAIELGWAGKPHPRSDIAEFHLRAGRHEEAAAIWAELKTSDPGSGGYPTASEPSLDVSAAALGQVDFEIAPAESQGPPDLEMGKASGTCQAVDRGYRQAQQLGDLVGGQQLVVERDDRVAHDRLRVVDVRTDGSGASSTIASAPTARAARRTASPIGSTT